MFDLAPLRRPPHDLVHAERSGQRTANGVLINEPLGGLAGLQGHAYFREIGRHVFC